MVKTVEINFNLPPRMYLKHGAYYYVSRENKWIRLSEDKVKLREKLDLINHWLDQCQL